MSSTENAILVTLLQKENASLRQQIEAYESTLKSLYFHTSSSWMLYDLAEKIEKVFAQYGKDIKKIME